MTHFEISNIVSDFCEEHGIKYVNTTDGNNGYPLFVKIGIIDFANSKQLTDAQEELQSILGNNASVEIEILSKKDGHKLYAHNSHFTHDHDYGFNLDERNLVDVSVPTDMIEPLVMKFHDDDVIFYAYGLVVYPNY